MRAHLRAEGGGRRGRGLPWKQVPIPDPAAPGTTVEAWHLSAEGGRHALKQVGP